MNYLPKKTFCNAFCECGARLTRDNNRVDVATGYIYKKCRKCFAKTRPSKARPRTDGNYIYG